MTIPNKSTLGPIVGMFAVCKDCRVLSDNLSDAADIAKVEVRLWVAHSSPYKREYIIFFHGCPPEWWTVQHKFALDQFLKENILQIDREAEKYCGELKGKLI